MLRLLSKIGGVTEGVYGNVHHMNFVTCKTNLGKSFIRILRTSLRVLFIHVMHEVLSVHSFALIPAFCDY